MNSNEEKLINSLKHDACNHDPILKPHGFFKNKYEVNLFYVDDHADLLMTVRALIHLSLRALDPEFVDDISEKSEDAYIRQALTIANRLMPHGEEAHLDHLNLYFREERLGIGLNKDEK